MLELAKRDARRIAVRAQLLDKERPVALLDVVRDLTMLQYDQTNAIAPSADVVAWSRIGSSYDPEDLARALDSRALIEIRGMIRPRSDVPLYRAEMARWATHGTQTGWRLDVQDWIRVNDACRTDILQRLELDGPLPTSSFPDTCQQKWGSSGWNDNKNVQMMLGVMVRRGEIASVGRDGRDRMWDLASRVYPPGQVPYDEAMRIRSEKRMRALGVARNRTTETQDERNDVGDVGEPAVIEGVRGRWRVDPDQLGQPFAGRVALLSPLDRLVVDRKRMSDIFDFDYQLEMYKPVAKRRWGYWAMPILWGDRLIGKLDATADPKAHVLRVDAIHEDEPFTKTAMAAVINEIKDLARWLQLDLDLPA